MKYGDFIELCKNKEWSGLRDFIRSLGSDLSAKIVATAIFEVHYPETHIAEAMGLRTWDNRLFNLPRQSLWDRFEGNVDLIDFTKAYQIATTGLNAESPGLNDDQVASAIKTYVYAHRFELNGLLECDIVEEKFKEIIRNIFGEIITDNEDLAEKNNLLDSRWVKKMKEEVEAKIFHMNQEELSDFFGYNQNELQLVRTPDTGVNLEFHPQPRPKVVKAYTEALKAMGIQAFQYDFPIHNGVAHVIHVKSSFEMSLQLALYDFSEYCGLTTHGFFAKAQQHADKAQELREKYRSDAELAASDFGQASNTAKSLKR